ncbi:MAG: HugZ family protein [Pseudorhodobacter sp.]
MPQHANPIQPADAEALALCHEILREARFAALAYQAPETGHPAISRIAFGLDAENCPLTLISDLAPHSAGLRSMPACAVMVGEPGPKGDPLTHPRLMIRAEAHFAPPGQRPALRDHWLADHPKSKLYIDFTDFAFVRLMPVSVMLNGGFARAFQIDRAQLLKAAET